MLDLAIFVRIQSTGTTIVETNHGTELKADVWPQDCDFQLVAFSPSGERGEIVRAEGLAADIAKALMTLDETGTLDPKPNWYRRLERYAE